MLIRCLGYPNNPGPSFASPGGLSLQDVVIVPQLGIGLAFAFRTDNQGSVLISLLPGCMNLRCSRPSDECR